MVGDTEREFTFASHRTRRPSLPPSPEIHLKTQRQENAERKKIFGFSATHRRLSLTHVLRKVKSYCLKVIGRADIVRLHFFVFK